MTEKRFTLMSVVNLDYGIADNDEPIGSLSNICDLMNSLVDENEQLKQRNNNQYNQLNQLWQIIEEENWEKLIAMKKQLKEDEEQLKREWACYE